LGIETSLPALRREVTALLGESEGDE